MPGPPTRGLRKRLDGQDRPPITVKIYFARFSSWCFLPIEPFQPAAVVTARASDLIRPVERTAGNSYCRRVLKFNAPQIHNAPACNLKLQQRPEVSRSTATRNLSLEKKRATNTAVASFSFSLSLSPSSFTLTHSAGVMDVNQKTGRRRAAEAYPRHSPITSPQGGRGGSTSESRRDSQ